MGRGGSEGQAEPERHRARQTKKNDETHYGYQNHINADQEPKWIQEDEVTHAAVHDSRVFEDLLDQTVDDNGDKRPVYADSASHSKEHGETLADAQIESQGCERGYGESGRDL
ncbi:MAG: transposase [Gammaproteobacteria bacterium]